MFKPLLLVTFFVKVISELFPGQLALRLLSHHDGLTTSRFLLGACADLNEKEGEVGRL